MTDSCGTSYIPHRNIVMAMIDPEIPIYNLWKVFQIYIHLQYFSSSPKFAITTQSAYAIKRSKKDLQIFYSLPQEEFYRKRVAWNRRDKRSSKMNSLSGVDRENRGFERGQSEIRRGGRVRGYWLVLLLLINVGHQRRLIDNSIDRQRMVKEDGFEGPFSNCGEQASRICIGL